MTDFVSQKPRLLEDLRTNLDALWPALRIKRRPRSMRQIRDHTYEDSEISILYDRQMRPTCGVPFGDRDSQINAALHAERTVASKQLARSIDRTSA